MNVERILSTWMHEFECMCIIKVKHILVVVEIKVIKIRTKQQYYIYILSYYILLHFFSKKRRMNTSSLWLKSLQTPDNYIVLVTVGKLSTGVSGK